MFHVTVFLKGQSQYFEELFILGSQIRYVHVRWDLLQGSHAVNI